MRRAMRPPQIFSSFPAGRLLILFLLAFRAKSLIIKAVDYISAYKEGAIAYRLPERITAVTNTNIHEHLGKRVLTARDIAVILGVSERHGYNFCNSTDLFDVIRIGSSIRAKRESFERWFGPVECVEKRVYTVKEVAALLDVSERHAGAYCTKTNDFTVLRVGSCIRVKKDSFDEWFGI